LINHDDPSPLMDVAAQDRIPHPVFIGPRPESFEGLRDKGTHLFRGRWMIPAAIESGDGADLEPFLARLFRGAAVYFMAARYTGPAPPWPGVNPLYPSTDPVNNALARTEIGHLQSALKSLDEEEILKKMEAFLATRQERRWGLGRHIVEYEERLEAIGGVAMYTERCFLTVIQGRSLGAERPSVQGVSGEEHCSALLARCGLTGYLFERFGFSVTGMAQAVLLDRLAPDWKTSYLSSEDMSLSHLLQEILWARER
jgi:hypothetical protein